MTPGDIGRAGSLRPEHTTSQFNSTAFVVQSMIDRISTAIPCRVVKVTNSGGLEPVGFVDLLPLVHQIDGDGRPMPYSSPIYHCPYFRLQGGANAIILDPKVGDIGLAIFAERDISSVVATKGPANPGSARRYDVSDALFIGLFLSDVVPGQYVQMNDAGIRIHSPTLVKIDAPTIEIACETFTMAATSGATITTPLLTINGAVTATGTVTAPTVVGTTDVTFGGKSGIGHRHNEHDGPVTTPPI